MKVLSAASEAYPLIKTGGLADVVGALPPALEAHGIDMRILLPGYKQVLAKLRKPKKLREFTGPAGARGTVLEATHEGRKLFALDAPALFDREGGPYSDPGGNDFADNWLRFAFFSRVAAEIAQGALPGFVPDVMQVHDWQAAMAPAYLRYSGKSAPPSVITIHNLAFQGRFPSSIFGELGLPPEAYSVEGVEYFGGVGFLKAGMQAASAITTVSPTYAQEIRTAEFGMGLEGLVNSRAGVLHGIVNGIDTEVWNPQADSAIARPFSARSLTARAANRKAVEAHIGLDHDDAPLLCVITRLTWQKGMDVLADSVDAIAGMGAKLAVLGAGDKALEGALLAASARHRGRVAIKVGYDEAFSHLLQAGSDAILIPSRFEPCGLTQLIALRYGCVPIVTRTGGLADTVIDANAAAEAAGVATGFVFSPLTRDALVQAVRRAVATHARPETWRAMQRQGMKADVSWSASAARYAELFRGLSARA
jgi:starch synthase